MAAIDTPWIGSMSANNRGSGENASNNEGVDAQGHATVAAFSPVSMSHAAAATKRRSTLLVQQKSPLLIATPPPVTRALAYSHPFLLPLNKLVGLLSWTTGDPWESFLLVVFFWAVTLYGGAITRWAGPVVVAIWLIIGMYSRRYSPLSSVGWTGEKLVGKRRRNDSEASSQRHQKSLDEIVDTLREFTSRCNILLDPFLRMTEFLSTQSTATSATTKPALTTLFSRILLITPVWIALTLPPWKIITSRRAILTLGTLILSWHSRPARISRTILWRSKTVRKFCTIASGLDFGESSSSGAKVSQHQTANTVASTSHAKRKPGSTGVRFTFILFENQRRWLGLGWTYSLFSYERAPWTDEHLNPSQSKDNFELPEVEDGAARWRWTEGSEWRVDGAAVSEDGSGKERRSGHKSVPGDGGWIYYDNKWRDGRRGTDSWGRYTRRRKWYRDAELVELSSSGEGTPNAVPMPPSPPPRPPRPSKVADAAGAKNVKPPPTPTEERSGNIPPPTPDAANTSGKATSTSNDADYEAEADARSIGSTDKKTRRRWFHRSDRSRSRSRIRDQTHSSDDTMASTHAGTSREYGSSLDIPGSDADSLRGRRD